MKKTLIGLAIGISILTLFAFTAMTVYEIKNSTAEVEQVQGLYIFYKSKPLTEYDYLGTVKPPAVVPAKPGNLLNAMIKRTKKQYPNADAIILDDNMYHPDAIKFKEK